MRRSIKKTIISPISSALCSVIFFVVGVTVVNEGKLLLGVVMLVSAVIVGISSAYDFYCTRVDSRRQGDDR